MRGTLPAQGSPYTVTCDIEVQSGESLLIGRGIILKFTSGTRFIVNGTLSVTGEAGGEVLFTSARMFPAVGDWEGIQVYGTVSVQYASIEYALRGMWFLPGSDGSVTDSDFGFDWTSLRLEHDVWPVLRRLTASGGNTNGILVTEGSNSSGTWTRAGIPYVLSDPSGMAIPFSGDVFTIEPGAILKFSMDTGLEVAGDLIAEGTAESPIIFTSLRDDSVGGDTNGDGNATVPSAGVWKELELSKLLASHRLRHLEFRFSRHGIIFSMGSTSYLQDSSFSDLTGWPVRLRSDAYPAMSGLTATRCQAGNGVLPEATSWGLDDGTWTDAGLPYVIDGELRHGFPMPNPAVLTIDSGAVIKLTPGSSLATHSGLVVQGTPGRPVVFTSLRDDTAGGDTNGDGAATAPAAGDWGTLAFDWVEWPDQRRLTHADVRYATTGVTVAGWEPTVLSDVRVSDSDIGLVCETPSALLVERGAFLRDGIAIDVRDECSDARIVDSRVSRATTALRCGGTVTIDHLDTDRSTEGILGVGGCSAVVTGSDFVGNDWGVRLVVPWGSIDLGNVSDFDPANDGGNDFSCNSYDVESSSAPVKAENNWWGELPPDPTQILGPVDIMPYDTGGSNALIPDLTVRLSPYSHEVQLEWGDRAPACGYHVWRSTIPDGGFADVSGLVMTSTWTDPGAAGSPDSYFYYVEIE